MTYTEAHRRFINRPNNETPMLMRYREAHGGTLVLEYPPLVTRSRDAATRKLDAVLLRETPSIQTRFGQTTIYDWELATPAERDMLDHLVATTDTEALQAKNAALGPYLLGQAHFSPRLTNSAIGVAIAGPGAPELLRIAKSLSVMVVHDPLAKSGQESRSLLKPDLASVEQLHQRVGGALLKRHAHGAGNSTGLVVDAIILPDKPNRGVVHTLTSVRGERAIAVCSTQHRLGMYVMGAAVCARARLLELGAAHAEVFILCKQSDSALGPLLRDHPGIKVVTRPDPLGEGRAPPTRTLPSTRTPRPVLD